MKTPTIHLILSLLYFVSITNAFSQDPSSLCTQGYVLCSNDPITVNSFLSNESVLLTSPCLPTKDLKNEVTFFWSMRFDSNLEFDILPTNPDDDLDFILYKIDPINYDCNNWEVKRCMAVGPNLIDQSLWEPCVGLTGIGNLGQNETKPYGCNVNENNYLRSLKSYSEDVFALKVTNFTSYEGFTLVFNNGLTFNPATSLPFESISLEEADLQILQSPGCVEKTGIILTDIDVSESNIAIQIYPNPTKNEVILKTKRIEINSIQIYNSEGKQISKVPFGGSKEAKIDLSSFQNGLYFFEILDKSGNTFTRSIVKI